MPCCHSLSCFKMCLDYYYSRYVSWQAAMLRPVNKVGQYDTVPFSSPHYSNYYVQEEVDDGVVMESTLAVKDVCVYFSFFLCHILFVFHG